MHEKGTFFFYGTHLHFKRDYFSVIDYNNTNNVQQKKNVLPFLGG